MAEWPLIMPLTDEARLALNGREAVEIDCLPFRIGRESRMAFSSGKLQYIERRKGTMSPNNELYLYDSRERLNISREHLQIDTGQAQRSRHRGEQGGLRGQTAAAALFSPGR